MYKSQKFQNMRISHREIYHTSSSSSSLFANLLPWCVSCISSPWIRFFIFQICNPIRDLCGRALNPENFWIFQNLLRSAVHLSPLSPLSSLWPCPNSRLRIGKLKWICRWLRFVFSDAVEEETAIERSRRRRRRRGGTIPTKCGSPEQLCETLPWSQLFRVAAAAAAGVSSAGPLHTALV